MMKLINTTRLLFVIILTNFLTPSFAQYNFPACSTPWVSGVYNQNDLVSYNGANYKANYWTNTVPGSDGSWVLQGLCGEDALGPDYDGAIRSIGYLPTWIEGFDASSFEPAVVTHINVAFLMFQQNNNNYLSEDFASVGFNSAEQRKVDSMLIDCNILSKSHQKGITVSVALGGATDFAFMWLMSKYYNNDSKLNELATLVADYINSRGLDGVDLDLECWWPDAAISGTTEQGGRVRGDKWGGTDVGPHPAAIGLTKFAQKLREKMPTKLISAAVFGTSNYGNNYDDAIVQYLDWLGLMTYDFTGSWTTSPFGPHSNLHTTPLSTYPSQSLDQPIYSATDALDYWMGTAPPAWNHDGGFNVPKAKLVIGVPLYGYDFSQRKPNNGNGYLFVPYKDIIAAYPNAATSYDVLDPQHTQGHIGLDGRNLYYETPIAAAAKINFVKDYGHQGVIIWELTQDAPYSSNSSILKSINNALGRDIITETPKGLIAKSETILSPNPAQDNVHIAVEEDANIIIYDVLGQLKYKGTLEKGNNTIDINSYTSGIYLVRIVANSTEETIKLKIK